MPQGFLAFSLGAISGKVHFTRNTEHLRDKQTAASQFLVIGRPGPSALEQFKNFVVADLQIAPPRLRQISGFRAMKHIH